jgi:transcription elongation GreA/GreB family factor
MPGGGGLTLSHDGKSISVITPSSPLGQALVGAKAGDEVVIQIGARIQEYEILAVS